jgi:hypothetical protein
MFIFVFTLPIFAQQITEDKAKEIVKNALTQIVPDYGKIDSEHGYYKMEYKLLLNGKKISEAEKKVKQAPNMKSGQLLLDFEKEISSKIKEATIEKVKYDKDDNKWKVYLNIPGIKIDKIEVNAASGEILPD